MRNQLGGQLPDALAIEFSIPDEVGPAAKIEGYLRFRLIHGQQKPVARNASFIAECRAQRRSQRQRAVLDRMMLIDLQVARAFKVQGKSAMFRDLLEHV